jgi:hypothetical protein
MGTTVRVVEALALGAMGTMAKEAEARVAMGTTVKEAEARVATGPMVKGVGARAQRLGKETPLMRTERTTGRQHAQSTQATQAMVEIADEVVAATDSPGDTYEALPLIRVGLVLFPRNRRLMRLSLEHLVVLHPAGR